MLHDYYYYITLTVIKTLQPASSLLSFLSSSYFSSNPEKKRKSFFKKHKNCHWLLFSQSKTLRFCSPKPELITVILFLKDLGFYSSNQNWFTFSLQVETEIINELTDSGQGFFKVLKCQPAWNVPKCCNSLYAWVKCSEMFRKSLALHFPRP